MHAVKQTARRAFNALALLSLVFFFVLALLWLHGMWYSDSVSYLGERGIVYELLTDPTSIEFQMNNLIEIDPSLASDNPPGWKIISERWSDGWWSYPPAHYKLGFGWERSDPSTGQKRMRFDVPFVLVMTIFGILPLIWLLGWKKGRRSKRGLCPQCGYDLRESKDRCPECGTAIPAAILPPPRSPEGN